MTTELKAIRKKRSPSKTTSLPSEGDHRKRRRNRTTQSCLNCHTSKRMCDRKRPCGRCTHLGQTGLCVYEVDDPSKRTDVQDESSRLRQRVAELEGVIRELKNKPHPRWAQTLSAEVKSEKENARSQSHSAAEQHQTEHQNEAINTSPSYSGSNPGSRDRSPQLPSYANTHPALAFSQIPAGLAKPSVPYSPYFSDVSCPLSTPSPSIMTPIDEYTQNQPLVAGDQTFAGEFDFAFMSYPGSMGCEYSHDLQVGGGILADNLGDNCRSKYHGHCGCLTEGPSYNVVLELSLRLRKAAEILLGSSNCCLSQRIIELDALAMTTLGSITTPPSDIN